MSSIDGQKVSLAIAVILWSILGSYFAQPLVHGNDSATTLIVTVFTVLAGVLMAVITLIGDPKSLPSGSWRKAELAYQRTYNRLMRHKWLFLLYLWVLALIFLSILFKGKLANYQSVIEYIYLFLANVAFILSLRLPSSLLAIQLERIEYEIEQRRKDAGIEKK
ncbi:hypothetical protein G3R49_12515 [Shewanella sp. WXL01]|uniref:hypothetical protein n=1 Tax=Shewanella sp. WXL01 TaxID=2709721 RepID=UPI0014385082|nr:hypothetical protein [Shewanella sp. WXL01]NKF51381.1 hypothetical protein [Shewanella sp. WXL01]